MLKNWVILLLGMLLCLMVQAQQAAVNPYYPLQQRLTHKEISQTFNRLFPLTKFKRRTYTRSEAYVELDDALTPFRSIDLSAQAKP